MVKLFIKFAIIFGGSYYFFGAYWTIAIAGFLLIIYGLFWVDNLIREEKLRKLKEVTFKVAEEERHAREKEAEEEQERLELEDKSKKG